VVEFRFREKAGHISQIVSEMQEIHVTSRAANFSSGSPVPSSQFNILLIIHQSYTLTLRNVILGMDTRGSIPTGLNTETNLFSVISRRYSRIESGNALILSTFVFILCTTHVTKNMNGVLLSQAPCILWVWRGDLRIGKTLGCYILEQRQAANLRCAERSNRICP